MLKLARFFKKAGGLMRYRVWRILFLYSALLMVFALPAIFLPLNTFNRYGAVVSADLLQDEMSEIQTQWQETQQTQQDKGADTIAGILLDRYPSYQYRWFYHLTADDGSVLLSYPAALLKRSDGHDRRRKWKVDKNTYAETVFVNRTNIPQDARGNKQALDRISNKDLERGIWRDLMREFIDDDDRDDHDDEDSYWKRNFSKRDKIKREAVVATTANFGDANLWFALRLNPDAPTTSRYILSSFLLTLFIGFMIMGFILARGILAEVNFISNEAKTIASSNDLLRRVPVVKAGRSRDEFSNLRSSWNAMLKRLHTQQTKLKHQASHIAHDLRTPLARLRIHLENLEKESANNPDLERKVSKAIEECDGLLERFNALLNLSDLESGGGIPMSDIDLKAVVAEAAELMEPLAEEKNQTFKVRLAEAKIRGNREIIAQCVINLLDNAIKYTPHGGSVVLSLRKNTKQGTARLDVSDSGPGIEPKKRSNVFLPFFRGDESRSSNGYGLGLSTVNAAVQFHGGSIKLAKSKDFSSGLSVRCDLPLMKKASKAS